MIEAVRFLQKYKLAVYCRASERGGGLFGKKFPHTDTYTRHPDWLSRALQHIFATTCGILRVMKFTEVANVL